MTVIVVTPSPTSFPAIGDCTTVGVGPQESLTVIATAGTCAWQLASADAPAGGIRLNNGGVVSRTIMVALVTVELPCTSVNVTGTVLVPTLSQSKVVWATFVLAMPQLSLEPATR